MVENELKLCLTEDGKWKLKSEPYATIEFETEEDFKQMQKELEFAKKMRKYHIRDIDLFAEVIQMGLTLKNASMDIKDLQKAIELFKNK